MAKSKAKSAKSKIKRTKKTHLFFKAKSAKSKIKRTKKTHLFLPHRKIIDDLIDDLIPRIQFPFLRRSYPLLKTFRILFTVINFFLKNKY